MITQQEVLKEGSTRSWVGYKQATIYLLLLLVYLALVVPLVLKTKSGVEDAQDESKYHYPTILTFAQEFPYLELSDYNAATTPLYHLIMMFAAFVVGPDLISLRLVSAAISLICLWVVYTYLSNRGGTASGLLFTLPFLLSPYFIGPAINLYTDNVALLFALLSLLMMDSHTIGRPRVLLANLFALLAVLTRQLYIWLVAVFLVSLWSPQREQSQTRQPRIDLLNALPVLLPIAGLGLFVLLWGGLTPARFLGRHEASSLLNGDVFIYIIALFGLYGACLAPWYLRLVRQNAQRYQFMHMVGLAALAMLFLWLNPLSNDYNEHRYGGALFLIMAQLPTLFSSSILCWVLFPLGFVFVYVTLVHLVSRREFVMACALLAWIAMNMSSAKIYQRYYESFLLFAIGYTLVTIQGRKTWYDWGSLALLLVGLSAMTFVDHVLPILL